MKTSGNGLAIALFVLCGSAAWATEKPAEVPVTYRYTLVTTATEEIGIVFVYTSEDELRAVTLLPPPPADRTIRTRDHVVLAEDGSRILLKAHWGGNRSADLQNLSVAPAKPRQSVERGKMVDEIYWLPTREGTPVKLTCTWSGSDIANIQLERGPEAGVQAP